MKKILMPLAGLLLVVLGLQTAVYAEGETVEVVVQGCQGILVSGGGYTPGQTLLTFARAPKGEGTITDQVEVKANADGELPSTTLKFGGEIPDGIYHAVITTPGPGQKEEVVKEFTVAGCLAGQRVVTAKADCQKVDVTGTGFEQTDATVEALVLGEGEMKAQVQPDAQGRFTASIPWSSVPLSGDHTVEVRIDNVKRAEVNFPVGNCVGAALPFTGVKVPFIPALLFGMILVLSGVVVVLLTRRIERN